MSSSHHIIISISSDIGFALAKKWLNEGHSVTGTFRTRSLLCDELEDMGANLVPCDLEDKTSINSAITIIKSGMHWNTLTIATGNQEPVGKFLTCNFESWHQSINVNFINQLKIVHGLMDHKSSLQSSVLFFAGGGTNNATVDYSDLSIIHI